jgi:hypothetical protein
MAVQRLQIDSFGCWSWSIQQETCMNYGLDEFIWCVFCIGSTSECDRISEIFKTAPSNIQLSVNGLFTKLLLCDPPQDRSKHPHIGGCLW